jgi:hypothetical protein
MLAILRANIAATVFGGLAAIFAIIAVAQSVKLNGFLWFDGVQDKLETATTNLNECREGRKQDRATYEQAQRDAKAKNDADVARIQAEQEKVNAEAKSRYNRDLRRLRNGGLRKDLAAPKGIAGQGGAPGVPQAACRDDAENLCVSRSLVMRAAEIELGRNALIDWINEQMKVGR